MKIFLCALLALFFPGILANRCDNRAYWKSFGRVEKCETGVHQSPINIDVDKTVVGRGCEIEFSGYDKSQVFMVKNNGHTVVVYPKDESNPAFMMAAPSKKWFQFAQLHFHWGANDKCGSEHTVNGYPSPLELHIVHYDPQYGNSLKEVIEKNVEDSLSVLSIRYHVDKHGHNGLHDIIKKFEDIEEEGEVTVTKPFKLKTLLPHEICPYFFYRGSLTTPGCQEIVMWTVLNSTVPIKDKQLEKFRNFEGAVTPLVDNFRSTQFLNGRKVFQYLE